MSKRHNVAYVKPEEPSFLRRLKEQAGYKEGPTVDTKREDLGAVADENLQDTEEELPTVVVLKPGDLTAEEASKEKARLEKETEEKPADLNSRFLFKAPTRSKTADDSSGKKRSSESQEKGKKSKKAKTKTLLSFNEDEEEEEKDD